MTAGALLAAATVYIGQAQVQVNPLIFGSWKLNLAKSVYTLGPPPSAQTQVYEPFEDGLGVAVETVTGSGARIRYRYAVRFDGNEFPLEGELTPNGAETIAVKAMDAFTWETTFRKGREVVLVTRTVLSRDGKTLTLTSRGTNRSEQPTHSVVVLEKQ